jgi:hypothetical protein
MLQMDMYKKSLHFEVIRISKLINIVIKTLQAHSQYGFHGVIFIIASTATIRTSLRLSRLFCGDHRAADQLRGYAKTFLGYLKVLAFRIVAE